MAERVAQPVRNEAHPGNAAGELRLRVSSDPANLASVRRACEGYCLRCGLDAAAAGDVGLCVNEAMANITRHAYEGATDKPVEINGWFDGSAVRITIRDWGNGKLPSPPRLNKDPMTPGGLGMVCLLELMDEIVYTPQPDGMLVTMTKRKR